MSDNLLASWIFYAILTFVWVALLIPFVLRMNLEPIRSRSPWAGMIGAFGLNITALFQVLRAQDAPIPCGFTDIIYQVIWSVSMASYFFRVIALLHSYERSQKLARRARRKEKQELKEAKHRMASANDHKMEVISRTSMSLMSHHRRGDSLVMSKRLSLKSEGRDRAREEDRFTRHTQHFYSQSPWNAMAYYAGFKSVFILIVVIAASADSLAQSWTKREKDCTVWGTVLSIIGDVCLIVYFVWLLRKNQVQDPFLITTELKLTIYMSISTMGPWGIIWIINARGLLDEEEFLFAKLYIILAFTLAAQVLVLGFPLFYTYAFLWRKDDSNVQRAKLTTVLLSRLYRDRFMKFLESEWSSENLLFFEEVSQWLALCEDSTRLTPPDCRHLLKRGRHLFRLYIDPNNAEFQVNLPSKLIHPLVVFFRDHRTQESITKAAAEQTPSHTGAVIKNPKPLLSAGVSDSKEVGLSTDEAKLGAGPPSVGQSYQSNLPPSRPKTPLADAKATSPVNVKINVGSNLAIERVGKLRELFEKAKKIAFQLMVRDSYNRFCNTEEGKKTMYEIKELKLERQNTEGELHDGL